MATNRVYAELGINPIRCHTPTAYARADDERRALAAGYQMHIPKPVESDLLAATVASLAGQEG